MIKENYPMEAQIKKKVVVINVIVYSLVGIFTIIANFSLYTYVTGNLIIWVLSIFYNFRPVVFPNMSLIYLSLLINLFFFLQVEYFIFFIFQKKINSLFKIDNLFTAKKFIFFSILIMFIQFIFSCWLLII